MSSVSPTQSTDAYLYYKNAVSDMEEDVKAEKTRSREREEERANKLEQSYNEAISKKEKEIEETAENIRNNSSENVERERRNAKEDANRVKAEVYDRFGRVQRDADGARRQVEDLQRNLEVIQQKEAFQRRKSEDLYAERISEASDRSLEKIEEATREAKEAAYRSMGKMKDSDRDEMSDLKQEMRFKYEEQDRTRNEDLDSLRRTMNRALEDSRKDYEHQTKATNDAAEQRLRSRADQGGIYLEEKQRILKESYAERDSDLRDQIKRLTDVEANYKKDYSQGRQEAIKEFEADWRERLDLANSSFEKDMIGVKRERDRSDTYFVRRNKEMMDEKDAQYTDVIKRKSQDEHDRIRDLEQEFLKERGVLEQQNKTERAQASKIVNKEMADADRRMASALEYQAKTNQETMARDRAADAYTIKNLEKILEDRKSSSDTTLISPAADAKMKDTLLREHHKLLTAEQERNRRSEDSILGEYSTRLSSLALEKDAARSKDIQGAAAEKHLERQAFLQHVYDLESQKEMDIQSRDIQRERESEKQSRANALAMERQRRSYEEMLDALKNDSNAKIQGIRQQAEFESKMVHREFNSRQNDLIRSYDKKFSDQKQEYETRMDDLRTEAQRMVHEAERRGKQAVDEQARSYEQRIAQMEYQQKERERLVTQNYQDELEKMKRSNALLAQKKS